MRCGLSSRARPVGPRPWSRTCPTTSRSLCCSISLRCCPRSSAGLVMVQAEVADRLAAAARVADLRHPVGQGGVVRRRTPSGLAVSRSVFWPAPNVDSGLVSFLRPRSTEPRPRAATRCSPSIDAAFAQRRKGLRAALRVARPGRPRRRGSRGRPVVEGASQRRAARSGGLRAPGRPSSPRWCGRERAPRCGSALRPRSTFPSVWARDVRTGTTRLATVYHAIGLFDEVVLRPADEDTLTVSGDAVDVGAVPTDEDNLVRRAVATARRAPR